MAAAKAREHRLARLSGEASEAILDREEWLAPPPLTPSISRLTRR